MNFWSPNLDSRGRVLRAVLGSLLLAGSVAVYFLTGSVLAAIFPAVGGGFCLFEAARGWCALRACGIKTRFSSLCARNKSSS
jgi:hypothetical protein